jgi:hypothetical protein
MTSPGWRADLDRFVRLLRERLRGDLVSVVLFGSRARGAARRDSDIDLLIVARNWPPSRLARHGVVLALAREISDDFADAVMAVLQRPEEAVNVKPYYLGMLSGHETLWDVDGFFEGILTRLRRRLAELGSRRYVDADGYEYWDLKPDWKPGDVVSL